MASEKKGYQLDEEEQMRLSALPGVTVYTLGSALAEAISPVYDWFLEQKGFCNICAREATEKEIAETLPEVFDALRRGEKLCEQHSEQSA